MIPALRLFLRDSWHRMWKLTRSTKSRQEFDRTSPYHYHRLNLHRLRNDLAQSSNKSLVKLLPLNLLPRRFQLLPSALHHKRCSKEPRKLYKGQEWAPLTNPTVPYYNLSHSNSQHRPQCNSSSSSHVSRISTRYGSRDSSMNSRVFKKFKKFPRLNQEPGCKSLNRYLQDINHLSRVNSRPYQQLQLCKLGSHPKDHRSVLLPLKLQMSRSGHGSSNLNYHSSNSSS